MSSPGSTSDRRRIANSMSRLRRRSSSSVSRSSTTDRKMPGCASTSRLMATGRKGMAGIGTVPTRRLPWAPLDSSVRSCAARRNSSKMATARGAKLRPCTVGSTPWATRSKSLKPSVSSSPAMALVTAGCDRCSTAAALRKLRCSSTATNTRNSLIFRCRGRRWIRPVVGQGMFMRMAFRGRTADRCADDYCPISFWYRPRTALAHFAATLRSAVRWGQSRCSREQGDRPLQQRRGPIEQAGKAAQCRRAADGSRRGRRGHRMP